MANAALNMNDDKIDFASSRLQDRFYETLLDDQDSASDLETLEDMGYESAPQDPPPSWVLKAIAV